MLMPRWWVELCDAIERWADTDFFEDEQDPAGE
jgi:hypothetical protein